MIYTNEDIKKINDKKRKRAKILSFLSIPLIVLILGIAISIVYQKHIKKASSIDIFGYKLYTILTGSMEPKYNIGDVIIDNPIAQKDIKVDTVITYALNQTTVTHRVVELVEKDGKTMYRTQGDNNNSPDTDLVDYSQVRGTIVFKISKLGKIISEFVSGIGFAALIVFVWISYIRSSRTEEKRIAREDARRRFNVPKYKKDKNV